ncbi:helix-turn-helix domain-containing protein [Humibacillus sp. DSM 29435]|uniref:helix-turn-helix domain-containing protein n=1 Tax=Humibacillus sp. DSM 29435 TaxID=1869167 RepID=UPI000B2DD403|nr:helix-turn-helix domain-containing protein [Humibacillus sp. DSM 29435]
MNSLRATAHPLRLQMLSLLTGAELSAAEVARELGTTQANASYHLRFLLDAGLLVIAGEENVRGGRAKKYRHPWDAELAAHDTHETHSSDEAGLAGSAASEADLDAYVRAFADMIPRRYRQRSLTPQTLLTDAELWVTPQAWAEVRDLLMSASRIVHEQAKPPRTQGTVRTNLSVAAFTMTTDPDSRR